MEAVEWTSIAITSGVLGNTAYDTIQRIREKSLGRRKLLRFPRLARDDALLIGRIAVEAFARQDGQPIDPERLVVRNSEQGRTRTWYLSFQHIDSDVSATNFHVRVYGNPRKVDVSAVYVQR